MNSMIEHNDIEFYDSFENINLLLKAFEIYSIRAQVGNRGAIIFEIRTKEQGHNTPHLHAKYENKNISISLVDYSVLSGNLHSKQAKIAVEWTRENIDFLKKKWNEYHCYTIPIY